MYPSICLYDELNTNNVAKFEAGLMQWCKKNGKNAVMIFDESSLDKIIEKLQQQLNIQPMKKQRYIQTDNLIIFWRCSKGEKAILETIMDNKGETLYDEPSSWEDSKIWYGR